MELAPESSAAHKALGNALEALSKKESAEKELAAAAKLGDKKSPRDGARARLYALPSEVSGRENPQVASNQPDGSVAPSFDELARRAAEAQGSGNRDLAMQSYQQALRVARVG